MEFGVGRKYTPSSAAPWVKTVGRKEVAIFQPDIVTLRENSNRQSQISDREDYGR